MKKLIVVIMLAFAVTANAGAFKHVLKPTFNKVVKPSTVKAGQGTKKVATATAKGTKKAVVVFAKGTKKVID